MTTSRTRFHVQAYDREGTAYAPFVAATLQEAQAEYQALIRGAKDDPDLQRVFIWPARTANWRTADMRGTPIASWVRGQRRPPVPATATRQPPSRPIRPGFIVRDALQRHPMSIAELHRAYKELVKDHNQSSAKKHQPMSYHSFHRYVAQMRLAGLVANVGEKPMEMANDPNPLINWGMSTFTSRGNNAVGREAVQVVVDLTAEGRRRPEAFHNVFYRPPGAPP